MSEPTLHLLAHSANCATYDLEDGWTLLIFSHLDVGMTYSASIKDPDSKVYPANRTFRKTSVIRSWATKEKRLQCHNNSTGA